MDFSTTGFWLALGSIIATNILLSGDNAVVIALASRNLAPKQQKQAIFWGSAAAIALRIFLTISAVQLLSLPYLKIIGSVMLLYIGIQLMAGSDDEEEMKAHPQLFGAIKTILIADLVMSLDNVVAVAAAAQKGPEETRFLLILIGLGLSIPLIIFGSTLLIKVMERFPIIIVLGAALLGLLAGEMFVEDPSIKHFLEVNLAESRSIFPLIGVAAVLGFGYFLKQLNVKTKFK